MLKDFLYSRKESAYKVAKGSKIPYTTLYELLSGKKKPAECSIKTYAALAAYWQISIDQVYEIALGEKEQDIEKKCPVLATTWEDARNQIYHFPIIAETDYFDISRVYPLKQRAILAIYQVLKKDDRIDSAILFGSSINIRCGRHSDIDLAISLKKNFISTDAKNEVSECIQEACGYNADILWLDRIDKGSQIDQNIRKGVKLL